MVSDKWNWPLLLGVSLVMFYTNLGGPKLWDRDEPRNAGCTLEMIQANDWIVPRFNGEVRTHKPVMLYWLMIPAYGVFGVTEFAARFWSAALGTLTVCLTYDLGRRLFNAQVAFWGGIVLATSLMFTVASRASTPDAPLIFFVTLAMWLYVRFSFPLDQAEDTESQQVDDSIDGFYPRRWWQVALIYAALGLAVLSKGPVGLILPTAIIGMFLLIQRLPRIQAPSTWWQRGVWLVRPFAPLHFVKTVVFMRPLLALAACLTVSLPWYVWVGLRDFSWIEGFFIQHNIGRAVNAMEDHSGPVYYYVLAVCVGFFPWSSFLAPLGFDLSRQLRTRSKFYWSVVFCLCWVGVWLGAFSIAQTKLPSYVTPIYPALALVMGCFIVRTQQHASSLSAGWFRLAHGVTIFVGVGLTAGLVLAARKYVPGTEAIAAVGLILAAGCGVVWWLHSMGHVQRAWQAYAAMSVAFGVSLFAWGAQQVSNQNRVESLFADIRRAAPHADICGYQAVEGTWVFYGRQAIEELHHEAELLEWLDSGSDLVVLTTPEKLATVSPSTQARLSEFAREHYFLEGTPILALRPVASLAKNHARSERDRRR